MTEPLRTLITANLAAVTAKDTEAAVAAFSTDGILIDPHYPRPHMRGHAQIREGFDWVFSGMRELNFTVDKWYFADEGTSAAVEVSSRHVLANGRTIEFGQCFAVDCRDDLVTRWQAYEPYGPGGIGGMFLGLGRLKFQLSKRR